MKVIGIGCGAVTLLVVAIIVWFGLSLFSEPDLTERPAYHPFRSAKAKARYLTHYDKRAQKWPVVSESRNIKTSYGQTFVRISGPVDAPPLVLLPGAGSTSLFWMPNIKALSVHYRVYAVDNIYDFGRSVYTRAFRTSDDLVKWLDDLFTALGFGNDINLMGLSYGGWLTSQYALNYPDRLHKIILLAPAATVLPFPGEWAWRGILSAIPHRYFMKKIMVDWAFEDLVHSENETHQIMLDEIIDDAIMGLKCFKFKMPVHPTVLEDDELQSITTATLFLVGENEKLYSADKAVQRLNKVAPHIETEIIANAGHDLTIVQADKVNRSVIAFLNGT